VTTLGLKREGVFYPDVEREAQIIAKREEWRTRLPGALDMRRTTLYAEGFALSEFDTRFPKLKETRDSIAHADERVVGKSRNKPIALKPIVGGPIHAPGGGVLILRSLFNDDFTTTSANGDVVSAPVTDDSLCVANRCIQAAIAGFAWHPPSRHWPDHPLNWK
jgi:hypothetical protein